MKAIRNLLSGIHPLTRFAMSAVLLYICLISIWPLIQNPFVAAVNRAANTLFGTFADQGLVIFERLTDTKNPERDTRIFFLNEEMIAQARLQTQGPAADIEAQHVDIICRTVAYLPFAMLIALVLATPIPGKRKLPALAAGLVLVAVFVAFKLGIFIWLKFNDFPQLNVALLTTFWKTALTYLNYIVVINIGPSLMTPAVIWILVSFRRPDWQVFRR